MISSSTEGVGNMFGKQEVKVFLEEKNIPFEWVEHKAVYTIEEMEEIIKRHISILISKSIIYNYKQW